MVPLTFGWENLPKAVSVYGADPASAHPVPGSRSALRGRRRVDPARHRVQPGLPSRPTDEGALPRPSRREYEAELPDPVRDPLVAAFDLVGLDPSIVSAVGVSHFHLDHSGGVRWFAGHVPVHAERAELDYAPSAQHPEPERAAIPPGRHRRPRDRTGRSRAATPEIAPGVTAVLTAGHTPGHQSFVVDLDDSVGGGGYVFVFDAADLQENLDHELAVGETIGVPNEASIEPIRRLKAIAAERGYRLLPGHDPDVWPAFTRDLGYPTWDLLDLSDPVRVHVAGRMAPEPRLRPAGRGRSASQWGSIQFDEEVGEALVAVDVTEVVAARGEHEHQVHLRAAGRSHPADAAGPITSSPSAFGGVFWNRLTGSWTGLVGMPAPPAASSKSRGSSGGGPRRRPGRRAPASTAGRACRAPPATCRPAA